MNKSGGALGVQKLNSANADSETTKEVPLREEYVMYYSGLDMISYCVKDQSGQIFGEGLIAATRKQAISYCGLYGAEDKSAGVAKRIPISKQRNRHLQTVLMEVAKPAAKLESRSGAGLCKGNSGGQQ
jgi:hypothetical protein